MRAAVYAFLTLGVSGCGTTRTSDTLRTGTEQMLLSTAIERAINDMDFSILKGADVYFDPQYLKGVSDEGYIISSMRQRLLSEGVLLKSKPNEATYIVEARAGAVGTNHQDVLIGIPQVSLPTGGLATGVPSAIPEIPFAKKTQQRAVIKLAAFAFNQKTGEAVWQSGTYPITADARDTWFLGTGPFQRGSIYSDTNFAGQRVKWLGRNKAGSAPHQPAPGLSITAGATFMTVLPPTPTEPSEIVPARSETLAPADSKDSASLKTNDPTKSSVFSPAVPPSQPQPGRVPSSEAAASSAAAPVSGFSASSTSTPDAKTSSGGNPAAAGLLLYHQKVINSPK